ncbi:MAG: XRE family transcriptional regulator [Pseudodesulfovibrio sp.]|uniref:Cupin 2 conserved barrel domain protein n=1 Tax=Pseudodesulfovibrio aespoeensis (strain ATCC 700646 / DSM 10631 / Aspo-2) TaxID=643562 RepID=E6VYA5_PSEA9|nr:MULTISPECIES: XRE family transcriptional regulator [Pseudodesulfovibrio]MBU4191231.1 XRE family transcriptional regulator [Pseudomonadota bacterium]ADU61563.1 Cupin 2 conserved barrel domain protein [Pseudodesulfovibrio aespoeensis Aspo-2]MBU4243606.1 XRE family transcriptional regulator [Pseudomonadota bacterium]MBU4379104.1 XRE family transcriptional regulator [Pseudomonadota bacterium]MBU4476247.1 XRE family transcriptional regulator [Pseudomonadota bacterium]
MDQYKEIAPRLIGLRESIGWTVKEMADLLGVSEQTVVGYESATNEIPVGYLLDVSRLCRVDLTTLISGREPHLKSHALVRKGEGFAVDRRKDYDYKSLGYKFAGRQMEPFLISVPPKDGETMTETSHRGQEFIYMLEGRLELRLAGEPLILEAGDSVYFDSETPHAMRGLDNRDAKFIDVIL